ncbi:hypothetical protein GH714_013404 [Hevea brasiliensis]|uniref:Uncharacterized protein n=1 Tax=Hevea brasiliensis TaxID=3981 RepID=A0A6A6L9H4_HEVBR|nr:hypothetical protein GH714_013404 [Hevea brasiliensis]
MYRDAVAAQFERLTLGMNTLRDDMNRILEEMRRDREERARGRDDARDRRQELTAPALALLLVFRTEASYSRFEEGRKAWTECHVIYGSDIVRDLRNLLEVDDLAVVGVLIEEPFSMLALDELCSQVHSNIQEAIGTEKVIQTQLVAKRKNYALSSHTKATLTVNSFEAGGDGGAPSECDNKFHSDKELVVALSTGWFDNKSRCLNYITIHGNGKSVKAKVVDECDSTMGCDSDHDYQPPCRNNIVDASKAVWNALGVSDPDDVGEMDIYWTDA